VGKLKDIHHKDDIRGSGEEISPICFPFIVASKFLRAVKSEMKKKPEIPSWLICRSQANELLSLKLWTFSTAADTAGSFCLNLTGGSRRKMRMLRLFTQVSTQAYKFRLPPALANLRRGFGQWIRRIEKRSTIRLQETILRNRDVLRCFFWSSLTGRFTTIP
jgi:hypothetical protein